ncbi:unnamed protein product [Caenorhabditis nigoni]
MVDNGSGTAEIQQEPTVTTSSRDNAQRDLILKERVQRLKNTWNYNEVGYAKGLAMVISVIKVGMCLVPSLFSSTILSLSIEHAGNSSFTHRVIDDIWSTSSNTLVFALLKATDFIISYVCAFIFDSYHNAYYGSRFILYGLILTATVICWILRAYEINALNIVSYNIFFYYNANFSSEQLGQISYLIEIVLLLGGSVLAEILRSAFPKRVHGFTQMMIVLLTLGSVFYDFIVGYVRRGREQAANNVIGLRLVGESLFYVGKEEELSKMKRLISEYEGINGQIGMFPEKWDNFMHHLRELRNNEDIARAQRLRLNEEVDVEVVTETNRRIRMNTM